MIDALRDQLNSYANRATNINALEDWLVANYQSMLDANDAESVGIADELTGMAVQLGEGVTREGEILSRVTTILRERETVLDCIDDGSGDTHVIVISGGVIIASSSSSNETVTPAAPPFVPV